jgi:hypothetical protein
VRGTAPIAKPNESTSERAGRRAERLVFERLRAALPDEYRLYPNVAWLGRTGPNRALRDGEADIVLAHPDKGLLVVEVKAGEISRDAGGRWWAGPALLSPSPFEQARNSWHALLAKLRDLPDAAAGFAPYGGHAVALPDVDLASAGPRLRLLGPDVDPILVLDHAKLPPDDPTATRRAVDAALDHWAGRDTRAGDTAGQHPPGPEGVALLDALLATPVELRSLLRGDIDEGRAEILRLTDGQAAVLRGLRRNRRMAIRGGAGTGKTLLAIEKARQLVREGYRTLLVSFNQPLARMLADATADLDATGLLTVSTFHQLCEDLGREAGVLPSRPDPVQAEWWNSTLPDTLVHAIDRLGATHQALVIDEGQDFEADWFENLQLLLTGGNDDVLYVFHDPAQSLFRADVVDGLGLQSLDLVYNCRNPQPIHDLVARFADGELDDEALRRDGKPVEIIEAARPAETLEALRRLLHRLRHDELVRPWEIAILAGRSLEHSDVWRQRSFGNEVLWNGQVDDAGRPNGLAADQVPDQPSDTILCDSIRRFKGLERPVVILTELAADDARLRQLLYVGLSRATQHAILVVTPEVARTVGRITS